MNGTPDRPEPTAPARAGHDTSWADSDDVEAYLTRQDRLGPRRAGEDVMLEVLPAAPERLLDLGCGDGRLTDLVLRARPSVCAAVGTDLSPPMLDAARLRFRRAARVRIVEHDMADSLGDLGTFDPVVSCFAILRRGVRGERCRRPRQRRVPGPVADGQGRADGRVASPMAELVEEAGSFARVLTDVVNGTVSTGMRFDVTPFQGPVDLA